MKPIPEIEENPNGLYRRYIVSKVSGEPIDPRAEYFVLRLDVHGKDMYHIIACRKAIRAYADAVKENIPVLSRDLLRRYPYLPPHVPKATDHSKWPHDHGDHPDRP